MTHGCDMSKVFITVALVIGKCLVTFKAWAHFFKFESFSGYLFIFVNWHKLAI